MCRRRGCTGISAPASRATRAAEGPAALMTRGDAIAPAEVVTPFTRALDRLHAGALDNLHAQLARAPREPGGDLGGAGEPVAGAPYGGDQIADLERGHQLARVVRRDQAHVAAQPVLEGDSLLEALELLLIRDQEEVADLLVSGVDAEFFLEAFEHPDGLEGEANLGLGRELDANAAGRLARRSRADRLALHDDDIALAAPRQVVGDAATHDAATDHDHAGCLRLLHGGRLYRGVILSGPCDGHGRSWPW